MSGAQNWQALGVGSLYGQNAVYESSNALSEARSSLDYARMGSPGRTPEATYPDGYIGTRTGSRREDRLVSKISQLNSRSYTRGVHAGSRQDPGDYVWPPEWNAKRGLVAQSHGMRTALMAMAPEPRLVRGGNDRPPQSANNTYMPPTSQASRSLLPAWA